MKRRQLWLKSIAREIKATAFGAVPRLKEMALVDIHDVMRACARLVFEFVVGNRRILVKKHRQLKQMEWRQIESKISEQMRRELRLWLVLNRAMTACLRDVMRVWINTRQAPRLKGQVIRKEGCSYRLTIREQSCFNHEEMVAYMQDRCHGTLRGARIYLNSKLKTLRRNGETAWIRVHPDSGGC